MKKPSKKTKTTTDLELLANGLGLSKVKDGTASLDKASEEYELIKNMRMSDLVEWVFASRTCGKPDMSVTANKIDLLSKVVKKAISLMYRNAAKELDIKIKGDTIEMSFKCDADNISLAGHSYVYPYIVEPKLSKSKKKVAIDIKNVR